MSVGQYLGLLATIVGVVGATFGLLWRRLDRLDRLAVTLHGVDNRLVAVETKVDVLLNLHELGELHMHRES
jgi:hypothetical protein